MASQSLTLVVDPASRSLMLQEHLRYTALGAVLQHRPETRLGIGTLVPEHPLVINHAGGAARLQLLSAPGASAGQSASWVQYDVQHPGTGHTHIWQLGANALDTSVPGSFSLGLQPPATSTNEVLYSQSAVLTVTPNGRVGVGLPAGARNPQAALHVYGTTKLDETLEVTGATLLRSSLTVADVAHLGATLDVVGNTRVTGATLLRSTLDVVGDVAVTGATTLRRTLDVVGAMAVTGATLLRSTLDVAGMLRVTDATVLRSTVDIVGALAVSGAATLYSSLGVSGTLTAEQLLWANRYGRSWDRRSGLIPSDQPGGTWGVGLGVGVQGGGYSDCLMMNNWADASGGNTNAVCLNKSAIGMRLYQGAFGAPTAMTAYKDVVCTDANSTDVSLPTQIRFPNNGAGLTWGTDFSRVYDDGHLHVATDDNLFLDVGGTNKVALWTGGVLTKDRTFVHVGTAGGGQNRFEGLEAVTNANGRAQLVVCSSYSDMVIASSQANDVHGSTLTFATYNPANAGDYRKFVMNQGNWGGRAHMLEFGYNSSGGRSNPHSNINDTDTVMTLDGSNKRLGVNNRFPAFPLDVRGRGAGDWTAIVESGGCATYLAHGAGYGMHINTGASASSSNYLLQLFSQNAERLKVNNDGNLWINGRHVLNEIDAQKKVNSWITSADGQPRTYYGNNDRTYFRSPNGFEFRNSGDGNIASIDNNGALYAQGRNIIGELNSLASRITALEGVNLNNVVRYGEDFIFWTAANGHHWGSYIHTHGDGRIGPAGYEHRTAYRIERRNF